MMNANTFSIFYVDSKTTAKFASHFKFTTIFYQITSSNQRKRLIYSSGKLKRYSLAQPKMMSVAKNLCILGRICLP